MHPALAQLDVAVLNYLIFEKILGLDAKALDDQETFKYSSKISDVVAAVTRREARLAFILNPTRIEQVQVVASAGLTMPRKSTYFYPKVMTGLVMTPSTRKRRSSSPKNSWGRPSLAATGEAGRGGRPAAKIPPPPCQPLNL